jgi:hypothetical protein
VASKKVQGTKSPGQGCEIRGTGEIVISGKFVDAVRVKFPWARGEELFNRMIAEGLFEVRPIEEFENSMKVLLRLTDKQHLRVPIPPGRDASAVRAT